MTDGDETTWKDFHDTVNMTASELEKCLDSDKFKEIGQKSGDSESTGHASGRRMATILESKRGDLSSDDYAHMRTVIGYVKRHLAQRPSGDATDTHWRYSLMNWGHDPC